MPDTTHEKTAGDISDTVTDHSLRSGESPHGYIERIRTVIERLQEDLQAAGASLDEADDQG